MASGPPSKSPAELAREAAHERQLQVTKDLRNFLVGKVVKTIFPDADPNAVHDTRTQDLIAYSRMVENDIFNAATTQEQYYHLLAEKIFKIQKEKRANTQPRPDQSNIPGPAELADRMKQEGQSSNNAPSSSQ